MKETANTFRSEVEGKIQKARAGLILDLPFFGSLALRLKVVEDPACPTAWTDGTSMGYNPAFIAPLKLGEVKGLICHEVMHLACAHHARRGAREHRKWNMAGDYAINQILADCKIPLPGERLLDPAFTGMNADEIYNRLPQPDGSSSDPGGTGEVRDAQGQGGQQPSPADLAQAEQDWKIAVAQAAAEAKVQGKLHASLARLTEEILAPKVDWREVLRRFVDTAARNDYRWFPPNRRFVHQGIYLPSVRSEELPPVVVVVDTSGSISQKELSQFAAEITAILEDYHTSCTVIYCDAEVAAVEEFSSDDFPICLYPKGGGGTDFRPPFRWVDKYDISLSCLIYLTDMECSSFPDEPPYPVLWAHIGKGGTAAPFGEEVKL